MRRLLGAMLVILACGSSPARGQGTVTLYSGTYSVYGAPGWYGTSYGSPSYGVPRTTSEFPSSFGPGYGYGYGRVGFLPGRYGVGLWRPGYAAPGYDYGASAHSYRTFPVADWPTPRRSGPPFGAYAPGFGPSPPPAR